jgi:hypothetical protein
VRARVHFYDDLSASQGTHFQIEGSGSVLCPSGSTVAPNTALGVRTDLDGQSYYLRVNCPEQAGSPNTTTATANRSLSAVELLPNPANGPVRRTRGWHLLEFTITPNGTFAHVDGRLIGGTDGSRPGVANAAQTDLALVQFGSAWGLNAVSHYDQLSVESGYFGPNALALSYTRFGTPWGENPVVASRSFSRSQNILARVMYFDDLDQTLSTQVMLADGAGASTGLGVHTPTSMAHYSLWVDGQVIDTQIPRSGGWHVFEVVATDRGTYAKIDNRFITAGHNDLMRHADRAQFLIGGTLSGQAVFDSLRVVAADQDPWQEQLFNPQYTSYNDYRGLTPSGNTIFTRLYPQLGYCAPGDVLTACGIHSNDFRSLMNTAVVFYMVGQHTSDAEARALARRVFDGAYANRPWVRPGQGVDAWARGAAMKSFIEAAVLLWPEFDQPLRDQIAQDIYWHAKTYYLDGVPFNGAVTNLPANGHVGDSRAEDNAWHATFLALTANLIPPPVGYDRGAVEAKARCFAYHSITTSADGPYCGVDTQTVYDDFRIENHNQVNPSYASGVLDIFAQASFSYIRSGRPIPWEFRHNVYPLYQKYLTYVDRDTYQFVGAPPDWDGAHNSAFISPGAIRLIEMLGYDPHISWQDYLGKRSIFFYDISSSWFEKPVSEVRIREWNQIDRNTDSLKFFLDMIDAGEFYANALRGLSIPGIGAATWHPLTAGQVSASAADASSPAAAAVDGDLTTRWSALDAGQWIEFDLGQPSTIALARIAFFRGTERTARFDLAVSQDGQIWAPLVTGGQSSGYTDLLQVIDFPDTRARYVRITGQGNSVDGWNSLTEVELWMQSQSAPGSDRLFIPLISTYR